MTTNLIALLSLICKHSSIGIGLYFINPNLGFLYVNSLICRGVVIISDFFALRAQFKVIQESMSGYKSRDN